jgi:hypothetical protein
MNFSELGGRGASRQTPFNIEASEGDGSVKVFFERYVYGPVPKERPDVDYETIEEGPVLDEKTDAIIGHRSQTRITFSREGRSISTLLLVYAPLGPGPFPAFVNLNMHGNQSTDDAEEIKESAVLSRLVHRMKERFHPSHRGAKKNRVNLRKALLRGYIFATAYYGDVFQDVWEGGTDGVPSLYPELSDSKRGDNLAGIGSWTWLMSRIVDRLEQDPRVDKRFIFASGHSRLGKVALNAADTDYRFFGVTSVASGKGGAALSQSRFGEPLRFLARRFGFWFPRNFRHVAENPHKAPFDQDAFLAGLPQKVHVIAGLKDPWTDYIGHQMAAHSANKMREKKNLAPIEISILPGVRHEMPDHAWDLILDSADRAIRESGKPLL